MLCFNVCLNHFAVLIYMLYAYTVVLVAYKIKRFLRDYWTILSGVVDEVKLSH
ncbi:hypothetical protein VCR31J2_2290067 [Vibrio coralliirubri]|uniref:Uncharacterized protein n=1 Tax=Vibrio coralliirubri TaxID=1516159 RepID=A0AA86WRY2_9VIBR|nr:hypothetical protein VCR31J2_2290067 [Vibrio coralliirubri]